MIHIVTTENRHLYRRQLWAMFEGRRAAFVERCGWGDLMVFDGAEVDDSDDERAVYLLALDVKEELLGAVRVRPTDDRCILVDRFPELIAEGQPPLKGPQVWEATRVFTTPLYRQTRRKGDHLLPLLALAACEVPFDHGAERIVGMIDMQYWAAQSDGPERVKFTGLPRAYAYGTMIGTMTPLSSGLLEQLREALALEVRVSYAVEEADVRAFGSLSGVQTAVDEAMRLDAFQIAEAERDGRLSAEARDKFDPKTRAIASIEALFAQSDAVLGAAAPQRPRRVDAA